MNSAELKKYLAAQGRTFEPKRGGGGHFVVWRCDRRSEPPTCTGPRKQLGTGLVNRILKDLGLQ
jgi:mRNA interferase HicA